MAPAFADADTHSGVETRPVADAHSVVDTHSVADAPAAAELLEGLLSPGDTVLAKGSRGVGGERVGQALLARETTGGVQAGPRGHPADGR